jgi:hypothetical protein
MGNTDYYITYKTVLFSVNPDILHFEIILNDVWQKKTRAPGGACFVSHHFSQQLPTPPKLERRI